MKKAKTIIDLLESRAANWILAVDENCKNLKPALENLKFRVLSFPDRTSDEDLHELLLKHKVNFFITKNGKHFEKYFKAPTYSKNQYYVLWLSHGIVANVEQTAKTIEGAILYDIRLKETPRSLDITGAYVTKLPRIRKKYLQSLKK